MLQINEKQKNCPDIMPDQNLKCPDIQHNWSENVQCLNALYSDNNSQKMVIPTSNGSHFVILGVSKKISVGS